MWGDNNQPGQRKNENVKFVLYLDAQDEEVRNIAEISVKTATQSTIAPGSYLFFCAQTKQKKQSMRQQGSFKFVI